MILKHPIRLLATLAVGVCLLAITAAASSTNVNHDADELALYCSWPPDYACAPGAFTFTASASCDGGVPNPARMISISAVGAATGQMNGFNEVTLTLTNVPPGAVTVTFSGVGESHTVTVWSLKVDIVQERVEYCVHHGADTLDLTEESYLGLGTAYWRRDGQYAGAGHSHAFTPSAMEPGTYTVTAEAAALSACQDTCTVHVVKVDLSVAGVASTNKSVAPGGLVCVNSDPSQTATRTELTINKCEPSDWDGSVELLWTAGNVKVYNAATGGDEVMSGQTFTNAVLPTKLWVEGTAASAAAGDIVFRLNPVGIECPQAAEGCDKVVMTAVKVETETFATTPADRTRKTVGVGEEVNMRIIPSGISGTWSTTGGSVNPTNGNATILEVPHAASSVTVTFSDGSGYSCAVPFSVLSPSGYIAPAATPITGYGANVAGAGMTLDLWLQPTNVSFYKVQVVEVGAVSTNAVGYFANTNVWSVSKLDHGHYGAGTWVRVDMDNYIGKDTANSGICPMPWEDGHFTWPIPGGWRVVGDTPTNNLSWSDQDFTIDTNGTVTVQKFGHGVTRTTNDVYTVVY